MKKLLMGAAAALTLAVAGQASAQSAGGVIGAGNVNGNLQSGASTSFDTSQSQSIDINIDNTLSAESGSGFVGNLTLGNGASAAQFHMDGLAGSVAGQIAGNAYSLSGNTADLNAAVQGNGSLTGQVVNFGQSQFTNSFTLDYEADSEVNFDAASFQSSNINFNAQAIFGAFSW
jgi:hypothetical protein